VVGYTKPFQKATLLCVNEEIFAQGRVGSFYAVMCMKSDARRTITEDFVM
jgi:hypothetical protein